MLNETWRTVVRNAGRVRPQLNSEAIQRHSNQTVEQLEPTRESGILNGVDPRTILAAIDIVRTRVGRRVAELDCGHAG